MLLESFTAFFFCLFLLQTPGCCLPPSGHSPTQSRFVKCCTDCCPSRRFSCSSPRNAVVRRCISMDLCHLHNWSPLWPVAWFVVGHRARGGKLNNPEAFTANNFFSWWQDEAKKVKLYRHRRRLTQRLGTSWLMRDAVFSSFPISAYWN